jgi:hypothetical protein
MAIRACSECGGPVERGFRFCPWCATPQRLKLVEFFRPHPLIREDRAQALRASWYLAPEESARHVRLSVWDERGDCARATAALSLDEHEALRLARFLESPVRPKRQPATLRMLVRELRESYLPSGRPR